MDIIAPKYLFVKLEIFFSLLWFGNNEESYYFMCLIACRPHFLFFVCLIRIIWMFLFYFFFEFFFVSIYQFFAEYLTIRLIASYPYAIRKFVNRLFSAFTRQWLLLYCNMYATFLSWYQQANPVLNIFYSPSPLY